ncbi:hypothetical protein PFMC_04192 [Plasmodium falciparum CAMP/Malaysia]|uniref:Plasmodium RESA N-terminal domain-containing protein n=1 Tax=Plasmodium falciparum (isolate Camp / Malaysia) TaxID=5835 RepID=A0A024X5F6_PLAFC|nr:hypothetical protein PFMC_04192 [Plasmodium falciparum CAMP/Malaysia]
MKCGITSRSFIFISLSLYAISLFYISLWNVYGLNIVQSTKYSVIISRNISEFENENNNIMERENRINHLDETNESSKNSNNSKKKELFDVLNSLEECPSKEDLKNIWVHTLGVAKEDLDHILKVLKALIQKYLNNDVYLGIDKDGYKEFLYESIWNENRSGFCTTIDNQEAEYSKNFFRLINTKHTLNDILKYINSFLEHFMTLKNELDDVCQKEHLEKISLSLRLFNY